MNLLFPIVVVVGALMAGLPRAASVIGTVDAGSPAAVAGLEPGDRILAVDGDPTRFWDDIDEHVRATRGGSIEITAEREGERFEVTVPVVVRRGLDDLGRSEQRGWLGLRNERLQPLIGVPDASSPAALAGLLSGDLVVRVGETEVGDWNGLVRAIRDAGGAPLELELRRGADTEDTLSVAISGVSDLDELGVVPATVLIAEVSVPSAAHDAGLLPGDLLLEVDGRPIGSFGTFAETVRASEGRELLLTYAREGGLHEVAVAPRLVSRKGELANIEEEFFQIGVRPHIGALPGEYEIEQYSNPIAALPRATEVTLEITGTFLRGLGMLLSGQVETKSLTGPIGIAQIARDSLDRGWWAYFAMMMLISINLGILNLLPIPVLDGGQALIYLVEGVKRSPISRRSRELVQSFGLVVLVMLMGLALWNDIARNWSDFVDWLTGGL
jgi:regulator of sigma E protease